MRTVAVAFALLLGAATLGAAVRLMPWLLDPRIPSGALAPFARGLLAMGLEAAMLTAWSIGWSLAAHRLVERGEARVLASLGEGPARTLGRLGAQGIVLATMLAATSYSLGRDAAAPGRIVNELLAQGRRACVRSSAPRTHGVPFVALTWLCRGASSPPRLVGRAPLGGVLFTARNARVSDDLRAIELDDARLARFAAASDDGAGLSVSAQVHHLELRGLSPWTHASALRPAFRSALITSAALLSASLSAYVLLRFRRKRESGVAAAAFGAAGPLAALAVLRSLELRVPAPSDIAARTVSPEVPDGGGRWAWTLAFALVPLAAALATAAAAVLVTALPEGRRAGS